MSTANYNALAGSLLTRGRVQPDGTSIPATTTVTADVLCQGDSTLVVEVDMAGAANGDLTVEVWPFEADGLTTEAIVLPPVIFVGPTFGGGKVVYYAQIDVTALEKVQIRVRNTTAGALVLNRASWRLQ